MNVRKQVMGYPGAIYKSFGTEAEAKEYLGISGCDKCGQGAGENESGVEKTVTTGSVQMEKQIQTRLRSTLTEATMLARKNFLTEWLF